MKMNTPFGFLSVALVAGTLVYLCPVNAGDLAFADPSLGTPPPSWAVGFADRSPELDALPGFRTPPPGFGTVPFYWWMGDPLTKERLKWQLEQMAGMGVSGYQINYAHSDKGGRSFGLTYPSEPAIFSAKWWDLVVWFMGETKKQGAGISLSDYTLGFGQGYMVDELLREHPEVRGQNLRMNSDGRVIPETVPWSLDPMHPQSGTWYAERFFGQFEKCASKEGGKGLNFFFSDELGFGVGNLIWSENFAKEFQRRKGYDIVPELPALFKDIGPRTPKIRLDYTDVMVSLSEEGFFKPVYEWHQKRGMIMGCDHGGRGLEVMEFGDYFRTQRWNQGPGADQPGLGKDLIKAKVASSIAHLYKRPRVWLEGFYGSGWGTTSASLIDATFANYAMGFNLLGIHGMYYTTHGGWWEWAPPDNTFRMPYWRHLQGFMDCQQRLAYLLSQGDHRCDVAVLYPVAPRQADMGGYASVQTAFGTGKEIYGKGIDFDFMDFESLARAKVVGKELHVSGEIYRVLILPAMRAVRHSTLQKAVEFKRAGGLVLAVGALPEASDRIGRDDPEVVSMVQELFPNGPTTNSVADIPFRDYIGPGYIQHRRIGPRDVYVIYNAQKGSECFFRAGGRVELWDPWTGGTKPLAVLSQDASGTRLALPLTQTEMQLIVFSPGKAEIVNAPGAPQESVIPLAGEWDFELAPSLDNRFGDFHWPPTKALIGAEARRLKYADETTAGLSWQEPKLDDSKWATVTCGFGPRFWKLGPLPTTAEADATLAALSQVDPAVPVKINGTDYCWQPHEFSWRFGLENDCAHQGWHGLKEQVGDELIGLGAIQHNMPSCGRALEPGGARYYLWSSMHAATAGEVPLARGGLLPSGAWLNNKPLAATASAVTLAAGANPLLLRYEQIGRGYFVAGVAEPAGSSSQVFFSTEARYIWWPGDTEGVANRYFRRAFKLDALPDTAHLRITCDNGYAVFINGKKAGHGNSWALIQEIDVRSLLTVGANVIAVDARNEGGEGALIAELTLCGKSKDTVRISSDATWRSAPQATGGWFETRYDDSSWGAAHVISPFEGSLWATHPSGPPRLDQVALAADGTPQSPPWNVGLASRWYGNTSVVPFDTRPKVPSPAGWYRFVAPPGLRGMTLPTRAKVQAWADGKPLVVKATASGVRVAIPEPSAAPIVVALRVEQNRGDYGGAAFDDFIRLACGPGRLPLGDWAKVGVLETYSGGAWYRKTMTLSREQLKGRVTLDLGNVAASAEVRINGKAAGTKVAPPWTLDITELVKPGENRIEVLVRNTLANHYVTIPTHYRGNTVSGLLGPVRLMTAE